MKNWIALSITLPAMLLMGACKTTDNSAPASSSAARTTGELKPAEATTMDPKYGNGADEEIPPYRLRLRTNRGERVTEF